MTTPSDGPIPEGHETESSGARSTQPDDAAGVELGLSDDQGGTFEPEEDPSPDG